jgi:transposase
LITLSIPMNLLFQHPARRGSAREFVKFLKRLDAETATDLELHLVLDNASAHKSATARRWLARHPRFHVHFIPTSSSWLNGRTLVR